MGSHVGPALVEESPTAGALLGARMPGSGFEYQTGLIGLGFRIQGLGMLA